MNQDDFTGLKHGAGFDPRFQLPDMTYSYADAPYGILDLIDDEWQHATLTLPDIEPREKQPTVEADHNIAAHRFFPQLQMDADDERKWVEEWMNESTKTNVDQLEKFL